jgi:Protein of unknown function (DUF2844)
MRLSAPHRRLFGRLAPCPGEMPGSRAHLSWVLQPQCRKRLNGPAHSSQTRFRWLLLAAAAALLGFSPPAKAYLGGDVTSVESDRVQMKASAQVTQHDAYEVHEIQMPAGTFVDEYVSPTGKVFAVTWRGQFPPPMQQILGTYFQQYTAALQAQPRTYGHRPLNIQEQGLVVQTAGHARSYFGRAYIPDLLPQGITLNQIQ